MQETYRTRASDELEHARLNDAALRRELQMLSEKVALLAKNTRDQTEAFRGVHESVAASATGVGRQVPGEDVPAGTMVGFLVKHQGYVLAALSTVAAVVVGAFSWLLTYNTQLVEDQHRQEDVTKALAATAESIKNTETSIQKTNGRVEEVDRSLRSDQSKIKTTLRKQTTFIVEQADDQRMLLEKLLRSSRVSVPPEPTSLKAARKDLQTLTDEL